MYHIPYIENYLSRMDQVNHMRKPLLTYLGQICNGLRFSLPHFQLEVLEKYKISMTQMMPNDWRILTSYFLFYKVKDFSPTFMVFNSLYSVKRYHDCFFKARHRTIGVSLSSRISG